MPRATGTGRRRTPRLGSWAAYGAGAALGIVLGKAIALPLAPPIALLLLTATDLALRHARRPPGTDRESAQRRPPRPASRRRRTRRGLNLPIRLLHRAPDVGSPGRACLRNTLRRAASCRLEPDRTVFANRCEALIATRSTGANNWAASSDRVMVDGATKAKIEIGLQSRPCSQTIKAQAKLHMTKLWTR